jgi:uncharacterized membrane protein
MATRQTSGKTAKRSAPSQSAAKTSRGGPAKAKGTPAKPAGSPAKANGKGPAAVSAAKSGKAAPPAPGKPSPWGRVVGAFRAAVDWSGGGVPFATMVVSLLGLADSIYLVIEHFSSNPTYACPENATINCLKVTTSAWSWLPAGPVSWSVPVSVAGLAFYVFMVIINSRWGWRAPWAAVHWVRLVSVIVGMLLVLYLVWAELFRIDAICLFCTGVHVLTFVLFGLVVGGVAFFGVRAIPDNR